MIVTRGFELTPWQRDAVAGAGKAGAGEPHRGTLEIFTGGGKTLVALTCAAIASSRDPDLRVAIVVPTVALARQWIDVIGRHCRSVERDRTAEAPLQGTPDEGIPVTVGRLGGGGKGNLHGSEILVGVLNTAAKQLPEMGRAAQPLMLIVDECHRAGAKQYSKVLDTPARYRLGLSATPEREDLDDQGEPITFDEQLVGRKLGDVVYRFTLRDARRIGWLPEYELHHHAVQLEPDERREYEAVSRRVDELRDRLRELGADASRAQQLSRRDGEIGAAASAYVAVTAHRKDLLYRARERTRVAERIVRSELDRGAARILLFHERTAEAELLFDRLSARGESAANPSPMRLEHSKLPSSRRAEALEAFRVGRARVLVSVRSLIEGIDVPEADVGVSVASSSSVRQRVQSLGRVLRRSFGDDDVPKTAHMHVLYVHDSVDDLIYGKEDWEDLTGEKANRYWLWPFDDGAPQEQPGPPRTPFPTEDQEWERLGQRIPDEPVPWQGAITGLEYSVDTMGTVSNRSKSVIANPQGVAAMMRAVRDRPGGRFRVTPLHRLVLIHEGGGPDSGWVLAGRLDEPFRSADEDPVERFDAPDAQPSALISGSTELRAGDQLLGAGDRSVGTFQLKQTQGGVIARKVSGGQDIALTEDTGAPELEANAIRVLEAWRSVLDRGITFHVDADGVAWFTDAGVRRYLASVPGGFAWPGELDGEV